MNKPKVALVTGAASGIGLETASALARTGAHLVLLDRSEEVHAVAASFRADGHSAEAVVADLADLEAARAACDGILAGHGAVDILVNNAGVHPKVKGGISHFTDISIDEWEFVFRINSTAPFVMCQRLVPAMMQNKWGRIINIASRAARAYSDRAGTHYSASKAAVIGMTRKIAGDFGAYGITANCVAPGQIETPLSRQFSPEVTAEAARRIPVKRIGRVQEIASAVVYLASDDASFVNGSVLDVNGGETMR